MGREKQVKLYIRGVGEGGGGVLFNKFKQEVFYCLKLYWDFLEAMEKG